MHENNLHSPNQFGYKKGHSTEMLLLHLNDTFLSAFDNKCATVLLLLDLSAAFDTVNQNKLLCMLYNKIGIRGNALKWFTSFLKGRTQQVLISSSYSEMTTLDHGVPQGSVLGPILFNIYLMPAYPVVHGTSFEIDGFADDHQVFKMFFPIFQSTVLTTSISQCLLSISNWMNTYFLKLNKAKTKIVVLASPSVVSSIKIHGTFVDGECIRFVDCKVDSHLNYSIHINKTVSSCFMVLKQIAKIRAFLPPDCINTIVTTLILPKIDYCNALFYKLSSVQLNKLQSVQNAAIRLFSTGENLPKTH